MNKCRHCGAFVPVEKAFCPNCSEPMEPEEAPNRASSSTSDMMSTLRDDPEQYREILQMLKKKPAAGAVEAPSSTPDPARAAPSAVAAYNTPQVAPNIAPPAKNKGNRALIIGTLSVLVLLVILLFILKVF
jgi:hypothetical protein